MRGGGGKKRAATKRFTGAFNKSMSAGDLRTIPGKMQRFAQGCNTGRKEGGRSRKALRGPETDDRKRVGKPGEGAEGVLRGGVCGVKVYPFRWNKRAARKMLWGKGAIASTPQMGGLGEGTGGRNRSEKSKNWKKLLAARGK